MASKASIVVSFLIAASVVAVNCNIEVDILNAWKNNLTDPNNVLQSWDPTLVNPCTYLHVTCNLDNSVTRLDLGNAGLSGPLIPELAQLTNLQYLEVAENNLSGSIPPEFGNLTKLVGLGLHHNYFTGPIPSAIANLKSLRFVRLNSNKLSGIVPRDIFDLARVGSLQLLNVSDNSFTGTYRPSNVSGYVVTTIIQDPKL